MITWIPRILTVLSLLALCSCNNKDPENASPKRMDYVVLVRAAFDVPDPLSMTRVQLQDRINSLKVKEEEISRWHRVVVNLEKITSNKAVVVEFQGMKGKYKFIYREGGVIETVEVKDAQ